MNRVSIIKQAVESVLRKLNNTEVEIGGCGYGNGKMTTSSRIISCRSESYGVNVDIYNDSLKVGGEDDDDSNDSRLERDLQRHFINILKDQSKGIEFFDWISSEKGHWGAILRLKEDKDMYKKIDKLRKKQGDLYTKISEFNRGLFKKLQEQKSKTKACRGCGSSLAISHLKSYKCPVCNSNLHSESEEKRLQSYKRKIDEIDAEIATLIAA